GLGANAQAPSTLATALGVTNIPVPPKTKRQDTKRQMAEMSSDDAYRTAIENDSLQDYQWFVESHPHYSLAGQIWDIINNRRDSVLWHRTLAFNSTSAYWNYLKRFPNGAHAWEARNWLYSRGQPLPPPDYVAVSSDLPPGYYDEAIGLPDIVRDGFGRPAAVFGPLAPIFVPDPPAWNRNRPIVIKITPAPQVPPNAKPSSPPCAGCGGSGLAPNPTPNLPINNGGNSASLSNTVNPTPTPALNNQQPNVQSLINQPVPPIVQPGPATTANNNSANGNQARTPVVACPNQGGNVTMLCGGATPEQQSQVNNLVKQLQADQNQKSAAAAANSNDLKSLTDQQLKERLAESVKHWQDEQKKKNDALAAKYNLPQGTPVLAMHPANAAEQRKVDDALAKLSPADRAKLPTRIGSVDIVQ
ncbi:MAG TPA: hypothetical protein VHA37_07110, partial [Candidatus Saccharimonadales bacterium]|nr:hypothetical protein [Candidatus Saccharimonadales bacterium]